MAKYYKLELQAKGILRFTGAKPVLVCVVLQGSIRARRTLLFTLPNYQRLVQIALTG